MSLDSCPAHLDYGLAIVSELNEVGEQTLRNPASGFERIPNGTAASGAIERLANEIREGDRVMVGVEAVCMNSVATSDNETVRDDWQVREITAKPRVAQPVSSIGEGGEHVITVNLSTGGLILLPGHEDTRPPVCETFGNLDTWRPGMFDTEYRRALAIFRLDDDARIFDFDDAANLVQIGMRPSEVVIRNTRATQRRAAALFEGGSWDGVSWWSYHHPAWTNYAVWNAQGRGRRSNSCTPRRST